MHTKRKSVYLLLWYGFLVLLNSDKYIRHKSVYVRHEEK